MNRSSKLAIATTAATLAILGGAAVYAQDNGGLPNYEAKGTISMAQAQTQGKTEGGDAVRPFSIHFPDEALADLKRRIAATRWPPQETVKDQSQGVQLATVQKLARYWATEYDWRKCEARLNALPNFVTRIDGVDIHFIHVRSKHPNALPMIVTHGWPGSILEQLKIIDPLTNPTAHGGSASDAFDVVIPSLPGYGFSAAPDRARLGSHPRRKSVGGPDEAARLQALRGAGRRLGECGHGADVPARRSGAGRDSHQHAGRGATRHRQGGVCRRTGALGPLGRRKARIRAACLLLQARTGLRHRDGEPPADAYTASADSPVGMAAWMIDHDADSMALITRVFDGQREGLTRDDVLDNATLYWLTNTTIPAARLYWESKLAFFAPKGVPIPAAVSAFANELYQAPESWAKQAYPKLVYYKRHDKGGHFAAWEQPQAVVSDLRAAFRELR